MINQEKKNDIAAVLRQKGVFLHCPMCGNTHFIMAESYVRLDLQDDFDGVKLGGPSLPSAAIVCDRCGFISLHALGLLGGIPQTNKGENDASKK